MSPHELIKSYIDKATPKNVSLKKQSNIRMELMCHICDKADFYKEIGYSEEESYEKALAEMGESEDVCKQFEDVYREKGAYAVMTFLAVHIMDIIAVALGIGGSFLSMEGDSGMSFSFESLILSLIFVCAIILLIIYAYTEKKKKILLAIAISNLIFSVTPFFFNSIYYPFAYTVLDILFNIDEALIDVRLFVSEFISVPLCIIGFVLYSVVKTKKDNLQKTNRQEKCRKIFSTITVCLTASLIGLVAVFAQSGSYDFYNYSVIADYISERKYEKECIELYNSINKDTSFKQADKILRDAGYIPHTEINTVIDDKEELEYITESLKEEIMEDPDIDVVYIKSEPYGDIYIHGTSIIIPKTDDKTIPRKKFNGEISLKNEFLYYITVLNEGQIYKARRDFETLKFGDSKQKVLELVGKNSSVESLKTEYNNNSVTETYYISCHEDNGDLFYYDNSDFYATLVFNNDSLVSGKYTYNRYYEEYDEEIESNVDKETEEEYVMEK